MSSRARLAGMRFECVLFDYDDTLVPTFALRARALELAARETLARAIDATGVLGASHGRSLEKMSLELADGDEGRAARLVDAYRAHYAATPLEAFAAYAGIADLLASLRAGGIRVGVVTSKSGPAARREIDATGLAPFIENLVAAEDVVRHKPEAEPLLRAMKALGARAATTLMVGDTSADLLGARNAAVASGAALWGAGDRDALLALAPEHVLEQPADVLALCAMTAPR